MPHWRKDGINERLVLRQNICRKGYRLYPLPNSKLVGQFNKILSKLGGFNVKTMIFRKISCLAHQWRGCGSGLSLTGSESNFKKTWIRHLKAIFNIFPFIYNHIVNWTLKTKSLFLHDFYRLLKKIKNLLCCFCFQCLDLNC